MHSVIKTGAILLASSLVAALPNPQPNAQNSGFSLEMTKRHDGNALDARDYGTLSKRAQGSAGISSISNNEKWTVDLVVGGQTLPAVLDTGSQDIWFESNQEPSSMTGSNHPLYTAPAGSSPISGAQWAARFDNNPTPAASGVAYYDKVVVGGATITSQIVGAATAVANANNVRKSGMLGLSYSPRQANYGGTVNPAPPALMMNMYQQLKISQFAVDLRTDNTGRLDFGFIDSSKYQGSLTYLDRNANSGNWMVSLDDVYYINKTRQTGSISNHATQGLTHVDTGAPKMAFPSAVVQNYYSSVPGSSQASDGTWLFPCSLVKNNKVPSFGVSIKGVEFDVPSNWMWAAQYGANCVGSLQTSATAGYNYSILGDTFLTTVFAVFDVFGPTNNGQVGFATKSLPTRPLPT